MSKGTLEQRMNVWSIQDQLDEEMKQKQLNLRLKVLRDQYIDSLIDKQLKVEYKPYSNNQNKFSKVFRNHKFKYHCIIS